MIVIAASSLCLNANLSLATFYRTRIRRGWDLVVPRFTAVAALSLAAYVLGVVAAGYETAVLFGASDWVPLLAHSGYMALFMIFMVALVAVLSAFARGILATVGIALALVIAVFPLLGVMPAVEAWLPTALPDSVKPLLTHAVGIAHYWRPALVAVGLSCVFLTVAVFRQRPLQSARPVKQ